MHRDESSRNGNLISRTWAKIVSNVIYLKRCACIQAWPGNKFVTKCVFYLLLLENNSIEISKLKRKCDFKQKYLDFLVKLLRILLLCAGKINIWNYLVWFFWVFFGILSLIFQKTIRHSLNFFARFTSKVHFI